MIDFDFETFTCLSWAFNLPEVFLIQSNLFFILILMEKKIFTNSFGIFIHFSILKQFGFFVLVQHAQFFETFSTSTHPTQKPYLFVIKLSTFDMRTNTFLSKAIICQQTNYHDYFRGKDRNKLNILHAGWKPANNQYIEILTTFWT